MNHQARGNPIFFFSAIAVVPKLARVTDSQDGRAVLNLKGNKQQMSKKTMGLGLFFVFLLHCCFRIFQPPFFNLSPSLPLIGGPHTIHRTLSPVLMLNGSNEYVVAAQREGNLSDLIRPLAFWHGTQGKQQPGHCSAKPVEMLASPDRICLLILTAVFPPISRHLCNKSPEAVMGSGCAMGKSDCFTHSASVTDELRISACEAFWHPMGAM